MARKSTKAQFEEREDKKEFDPSEEKKNEEAKDGKEGKTDFSSEKEEKEEKKTKKVKKERKPRKPASANSPIHQVMPVVMLALCAFLGICIYTAIPVGVVGAAVHTAFFGVLGRAAYFAPVLVLLVALFWQRDVQNQVLGRKIAFGFVLLALTAILFYTFGVAEADKNAFSSFWKMGVDGVGGGVLGNCIGFGLYYCFAQTGTVIVTALLLAVFAVLFFRIRLSAVFHAIGSACRQAAEKRAEAKRRAAQARVQEEERKREQKERAEADFYAKAAVSTPTAPRAEAGGKSTPAHELFTAGTTPEKKPVARKLFDAAAEEVVNRNPSEEVGTKREQAPATPAPFHDDLFNDDPIDPALLVGDEDDTVGTAGKELPVLPETAGAEQSNAKVTFVSDKPIPERPVRPIPLAPDPVSDPVSEPKPDAAEIPASDSVSEESDGERGENEGGKKENSQEASAANASTEKDTQEEEKIVINKAHTIEHIGADTFIDGDESYYKSGSADTFFYKFPPLSLLQEDTEVNQEDSDQEITEKAARLKKTLESYGVQAEIKCISRGPRLTRYELVPKEGVRIRAIESLVDEIAMNLEAVSVRIEAPIPGKAAIGVEVPNVKYSTVRLRGLLDTDKFRDAVGKTTVCLGVDVVGVPVFADLEKMPHLLVAGATGMGKSVCINSLLVSLLYKAKPDEVKLILIDPKKVEFKSYYNIPHLLVPVVTEPQMAAGALSWAVNEMERRYDIIERVGVRNIKAYNTTLADHPEREHLPHIVIVIDELHDLMLQAKDAVEDSIARIAAKARAAGILLIIGTQRPSVNVITGVIKANIPSRIAFHVASQVDSRTIIDAAGAEKLLNNGDMLFLSPGMQMMTPKRVQGAFLDDDEVTRVADYLRRNSSAVHYDETIMADMDRESEKYNKEKKSVDSDAFGADGEGSGNSEDDLLYRAIEVALENGKISTSLLQRRLSLGFGKAARIIDRMQEMGIVSAPNGQKPRDILITEDEYRAMRLKHDD